MKSEIDKALANPVKRMKDADREVEYLSTDELLKRKRALTKKRSLFKQVTVVRGRNL